MRLVHDADNVVGIPCLADIPAQLRKFADAIERGQYGEVVSVYALIDTPDNLHTEVFGEELSRYEALGILAFAQAACIGLD